MPTKEAMILRPRYFGAIIVPGDLVWHPKFGRAVAASVKPRYDADAAAVCGSVNLVPQTEDDVRLVAVEAFSEDWLGIWLQMQHKPLAPEPGPMMRPGGDGFLRLHPYLFYPGEPVLEGDAIYMPNSRSPLFINKVFPPGELPDVVVGSYPPARLKYGVVEIFAGNLPSARRVPNQIFLPIYSVAWSGVRLVAHRPPAAAGI